MPDSIANRLADRRARKMQAVAIWNGYLDQEDWYLLNTDAQRAEARARAAETGMEWPVWVVRPARDQDGIRVRDPAGDFVIEHRTHERFGADGFSVREFQQDIFYMLRTFRVDMGFGEKFPHGLILVLSTTGEVNCYSRAGADDAIPPDAKRVEGWWYEENVGLDDNDATLLSAAEGAALTLAEDAGTFGPKWGLVRDGVCFLPAEKKETLSRESFLEAMVSRINEAKEWDAAIKDGQIHVCKIGEEEYRRENWAVIAVAPDLRRVLMWRGSLDLLSILASQTMSLNPDTEIGTADCWESLQTLANQ